MVKNSKSKEKHAEERKNDCAFFRNATHMTSVDFSLMIGTFRKIIHSSLEKNNFLKNMGELWIEFETSER